MTISSKRHFLHLCVQLSLRLLCLRIAVRTPNLDGDSVLKSTDHGQSGFPNDQETPGFSWPSTWKILQLLAIHVHLGNSSWCSRMCWWPSRSSNASRMPHLAKSCIPRNHLQVSITQTGKLWSKLARSKWKTCEKPELNEVSTRSIQYWGWRSSKNCRILPRHPVYQNCHL